MNKIEIEEKNKSEMKKRKPIDILAIVKANIAARISPESQIPTQARRQQTTNLKKNPNCLERALFIHLNSTFEPEEEDTSKIHKLNQFPENLHLKNLYSIYEKEKTKLSSGYFDYALITPILRIIKHDLILSGIYKTIQVILEYSITLLIKYYLKQIKRDDKDYVLVIGYVAAILMVNLCTGLVREKAIDHKNKSKATASQILRGLFYNKLKKANYRFLEDADASFISNVLFYEIDKIVDFLGDIPSLLTIPISIVLSFIFVYLQVNYMVWLPLQVFLILLGTKSLIQAKYIRLRISFSVVNAKRAMLLHQIGPIIKDIKISCQEDVYIKQLEDIRLEEYKLLNKIHFLKSVISSFDLIMPVFCGVATIWLYNEAKDEFLSIEDTYQIISVFSICSKPFEQVSDTWSMFSFFHSSYKALKFFLDYTIEKDDTLLNGLLDICINMKRSETDPIETDSATKLNNSQEIQKESLNNLDENTLREEHAIKITRGEFSIDFTTSKKVLRLFFSKNFAELEEEDEAYSRLSGTDHDKAPETKSDNILTNILSGLNVNILKGQLVCISGKRGSGKSMFCLSLMRETVLVHGNLFTKGELRFLSYDYPSFVSGTIRDNIVLGSRYERDRYNEIIYSLELDLERFAGEDFMEITGDGNNLGKLEKIKILLARMIYQGGDIFVFDTFFDEISEYDRVSIFKKAILNNLKTDKTVVYISNDPELMKYADQIIVLNEGKIINQGRFYKILTIPESPFKGIFSDAIFKDLLRNYIPENSNTLANSTRFFFEDKLIESKELQKKALSINERSLKAKNIFKAFTNRIDKQQKGTKTESHNFDMEFSTWKAFKYLVLSGGRFSTIIMLLLVFTSNISMLVLDLWLGVWSANLLKLTPLSYLYSYVLIAASSIVFTLLSDLFYRRAVRIGLMNLYSDATTSLFKVGADFYSRVPINRIVYRLTKDLLIVDEELVESMNNFLTEIFFIAGGLVVLISITVGVYAIFVIVGLIYLIIKLRKAFDKSFQFLSISISERSELLAVLLKVLNCTLLLRNFGKGAYFDDKINSISNNFQNASSHVANVTGRWVGMRLVIFGFFQMFSILILSIFAADFGVGLVGYQFWMISFSLTWVNKLVRRSSSLVTTLFSVRDQTTSFYRVKEYVLDKEERLHTFVYDKTSKAIEVKNFDYSISGEKILKNINFSIGHGEFTCIFGLLGSGKHSLVDALLKLSDTSSLPSSEFEVFKVFGQRISHLSTASLRGSLLYLPCSPLPLLSSASDFYSSPSHLKALEFMGFATFLESAKTENARVQGVPAGPSEAEEGEKKGGRSLVTF